MRRINFTYWHPHAPGPEPEECQLDEFLFRAFGRETSLLFGYFPSKNYLNGLFARGHNDKKDYLWEPFEIADDEFEALFEATKIRLLSIGKTLELREIPEWVNRSEVLFAFYLNVPESEVREFSDRLEVLKHRRSAAIEGHDDHLAEKIENQEDFEIDQFAEINIIPRLPKKHG